MEEDNFGNRNGGSRGDPGYFVKNMSWNDKKTNRTVRSGCTANSTSPEILNAIETDAPIVYNGRKHVGLQNIRKRLQLLYGSEASVTFFNMDENFGAVVEVRLPGRV